jgi:hypothetical protein
MKLIFLLEERSMAETLKIILPKILSEGVEFLCIPHEGKSDLQNSISRKLQTWKETNAKFVIVHDNDSSDCKKLKRELVNLAKNCKREDTLVRIVCPELESWFLGDLSAVEKAFNVNLAKKKNKAIYRYPDKIQNAKQELKKLIPMYQPILGSQSIALNMDIDSNKSRSFQVFVEGVRRISDFVLVENLLV